MKTPFKFRAFSPSATVNSTESVKELKIHFLSLTHPNSLKFPAAYIILHEKQRKFPPGSRIDFIANRPTLCFQDGTFHSNPSISVLQEPYYKFAKRFLDSRKSQLFLSCSWPIVLMHPHKLYIKTLDLSGCLWYGMTYTFSLRLMFSRGASQPFFSLSI